MRLKHAVAVLCLSAAGLIAGGCASTAGGAPADTPGTAAAAGSEDTREARCRAAIRDVTTYCSEENLRRSKCDDAKARSRDFCI